MTFRREFSMQPSSYFLKEASAAQASTRSPRLLRQAKPTIYAHFPGKEALFTAVVGRTINGLTDFEGFTPQGRTVQDKLTNLGTEIVERFIADTRDLTRATIAEAQRFPELSRNVHDAARDRAAGAVSQLLNEAAQDLRAHQRDHSVASENSLLRRCLWISFCFRC